MKSCVIHIDMEKGLLQNGEVLQQPLFSCPDRPLRTRKALLGKRELVRMGTEMYGVERRTRKPMT